MALVKEDTRTEPDGSVMVFQYYEDKRLAIIWHGTGGSFGCTMNPKKDPIVGPTTYELYQMLNEASLEYTITGCPHIVFNGERWRVSEQLYPLADSIKKPVQKEGIEKPVQKDPFPQTKTCTKCSWSQKVPSRILREEYQRHARLTIG